LIGQRAPILEHILIEQEHVVESRETAFQTDKKVNAEESDNNTEKRKQNQTIFRNTQEALPKVHNHRANSDGDIEREKLAGKRISRKRRVVWPKDEWGEEEIFG
jgi:hypothetical protein